jgi:hypothetical protein
LGINKGHSHSFNLLIYSIAAILVIIIASIIVSYVPVQRDLDNLTENEIHHILSIGEEEMLGNHFEVSPYIDQNNTWTGLVQSPSSEDTQSYGKGNWTAVITQPTDQGTGYKLSLEHEEGIIWEGTIQKNTVNETRYQFNVTDNTNKNDIKNLVMVYIVEKHPELAELVEDPENMIWQKTGSRIQEGYSEFSYSSQGWNMTIGYVITAPEYRQHDIILENSEHGIKWTGTVKDGEVKEKKSSEKKKQNPEDLNPKLTAT